MSNGMKYLVFNVELGEEIVLFSATIEHAGFSRMMPKHWKPIRGGFVWIVEGAVQCYGESLSLGVQSDRKKDTEMLARQLMQDPTY
jgi:hypothetical protein